MKPKSNKKQESKTELGEEEKMRKTKERKKQQKIK